MISSNAAIEVSHLAKRFGDVTALADLSLRVERGEIFGFLGPNGAGKTTSVKMLVGLVHPSGGQGTLLGMPLGDRAARRRVGYLPELFRYQEWLSAREVLGVHTSLMGMPRSEREAEIARVLDLVGLTERADDRVATYSKGMQQRLGIGVALLGDPELVILDEPTSALDPVGRHDVRALMRRLKERGTTVFLNSHLLTEVEQVCDRVAIVRKGRVIADGSLAQIAGAEVGVRIRAVADGIALTATLAPFGELREETGAIVVFGVDRDRIPDLVWALADSGARIYAVEPIAQTLEERFLEMVEES